jgi:serine/threonine-protein kinase
MVWVSSPDSNGNIYAFDRTNGTVRVFPDTWQNGVDPERGGDSPPDGLIEPIRGFGKVWHEQAGVRDTLGWATNGEQGAEATLLAFETGQLLALPQTNEIIAVGNDGNWSATSGTP